MLFEDWEKKLRDSLGVEGAPLRLRNGQFWEVLNKDDVLNFFSEKIFDKQLDVIKDICVSVLKEVDPKFELEPDRRYIAAIYDKNLKHSHNLRSGLSETLVWLGVHGDLLINCNPDKRKFLARWAVREIFSDASWELWGSLNRLLPTLAESAPIEFMDAVQNSLSIDPCPFDVLFKQQNTGVGGENYLAGLFWALEGLAWSEEFFSRACKIFAGLAEHENTESNWVNRPSNSLISILLPWHHQTHAPILKRVAAMEAIRKSNPDIAWKVLLALLPRSHQSTSGTHKPKWRNPVPDDWEPKVTNKEYWNQVDRYASMTVDMAIADIEKSKLLVGNIDNLTKEPLHKFLDFLSSDDVVLLGDATRTPIWEKLVEVSNKHRRYPDAKWVMPNELIEQIEVIADQLKPNSPAYTSERLFGRREFELYEENGDWESERKKLESKRRDAINAILEGDGLEAVLEFSRKVEMPGYVGVSLGGIDTIHIDSNLLPALLNTTEQAEKQFISSYIFARSQEKGWEWVDALDKASWTKDELSALLIYLPFCRNSWERASEFLKEDEVLYWKSVDVNPYQTDDDLTPAIDKLLNYGRPGRAIDCLYCQKHRDLPLDIERSVKALLMPMTDEDFIVTLGVSHITDLIEALQENPDTPDDDMCRIEGRFLQILGENHQAKPKFLYKKLSVDPEFFCEIISLIYRSKDDPAEGVEQDEVKRGIATNAWHLLYGWKLMPGLQGDGLFSPEEFKKWYESSRVLCEKAGRLEFALSEIGKILFYAPSDPDGLWMHRVVLDVLESNESVQIRESFCGEIFNSRGVHWVDPTGKPELELANEWYRKAEDVEIKGHAPLFASALREVAAEYERDAERIRRQHGGED